MLTLVFVCATSLWQIQSAPPDVPKDHWAFPAVDTLFREGLLKGYPWEKQPALKLDKSIKRNLKQAAHIVLGQWRSEGLLVGYLDLKHRQEPTNYDLAVAVHAAWTNAVNLLKDRLVLVEQHPAFNMILEDMVEMISMFDPELHKLGVNPNEMIAKINDLHLSRYRLFHGER